MEIGIQLFNSDSGAGYENRISGLLRDDDGTVAYASSSAAPVSDTWYHVVFVRSGTAGSNTLQLYINGVLDCNMEGAAADDVAAVDGIGADRIGGSPEGAISWLGSIGPYRIYNRSLNSEEALQNFNAQRGRFGL